MEGRLRGLGNRERFEGFITVKDLKDSYPVQLANYVVANGIQEKPTFSWWIPYTLKKRTAIISKVKSKYWERSHKYRVRVPKNVKGAKRIDAKNGDKLQ